MFCLRRKSVRQLRLLQAREELKHRYESCKNTLKNDKTRALVLLIDFESFVAMEFTPLLTENQYYTPTMLSEDSHMIDDLKTQKLNLLELIYSKLKE